MAIKSLRMENAYICNRLTQEFNPPHLFCQCLMFCFFLPVNWMGKSFERLPRKCGVACQDSMSMEIFINIRVEFILNPFLSMQITQKIQVIQSVTLKYPLVGGQGQPLKGSQKNHPKKVQAGPPRPAGWYWALPNSPWKWPG